MLFWYYKLALFSTYILFYFSLSNQEPVKRARNRNVQRSSSEDTDTNGKKYETRNKLSFNKYLRNFKMSSTVVDSYSSMESPIFSIPQHRKIRRGLSDIDPKYVSQVRHFWISYSLFWRLDVFLLFHSELNQNNIYIVFYNTLNSSLMKNFSLLKCRI